MNNKRMFRIVTWNSKLISKGQLISIHFFLTFRYSKKPTKFFTYFWPRSGWTTQKWSTLLLITLVFRSMYVSEEKISFEITWPLELFKICQFCVKPCFWKSLAEIILFKATLNQLMASLCCNRKKFLKGFYVNQIAAG